MIVCPVCEHPQAQGSECDVCGKRLVAGPSAADLAIPPVDGLEPTLQGPVDAGGDRLLELEPTQQGAAGDLAPDATPDLEATAAAPVDVDVEATPDLERTAAEIPGDARTPEPVTVVCRYCRTPAMPGERLCSRCGVRLPVLPARGAVAHAPALRHCSCGTVVRAEAALCPGCGARLGRS